MDFAKGLLVLSGSNKCLQECWCVFKQDLTVSGYAEQMFWALGYFISLLAGSWLPQNLSCPFAN